MEKQEFYEGQPIKVRGKEYIVPGLSFAQLEKHVKVIERLNDKKNKGALTPQIVQDIVTVVHAAMSRNYPELKPDDIKNMLDTRNAGHFVQVIMGLSGFEQMSVDGDAQGETEPVA